MKLTLHIIRKDLRRLGSVLVLWALVYLAEFVAGARLLHEGIGNMYQFDRYQIFTWIMVGLKYAIGYLLTAALIHEDPLVGTTAFWPTRPISGARLLGAKAGTCLIVFGLFPIAMALPWWLYCGYGLHELPLAAIDIGGSQALPVLIGVLVASLTGTLGRFLAGTLGVLVFVPVALWCFAEGHPAVTEDTFAVASWPWPHLMRYAPLAGLVVIAHQFLTRRLARSLAVLVSLAAAVLLACALVPVNLPPSGRQPQDVLAGLPVDDRIAFDFKEAFEGTVNLPNGAPQALYRETFSIRNKPKDLTVHFTKTRFEWEWPDGTRLNPTSYGAAYGSARFHPPRPVMDPPWDWYARVRMLARGGRHRSDATFGPFYGESDGSVWEFYQEALPEMGARLRSGPASLQVQFEGYFESWEALPPLALEEGSHLENGAEGLRISRIRWDGDRRQLDVDEIEHHPDYTVVFNPWTDISARWFTAVNRARGEAAASARGYSVALRIDTVAIAFRRIELRVPHHMEGDKWVQTDSPDWFNGAILERSLERRVSRFKGNVTVSPFAPRPDPDQAP